MLRLPTDNSFPKKAREQAGRIIRANYTRYLDSRLSEIRGARFLVSDASAVTVGYAFGVDREKLRQQRGAGAYAILDRWQCGPHARA